MTDTKTDMPTKGEYNDAIDKLDAVFGNEANDLMSMIAITRDDEMFHDTELAGERYECRHDCSGCMTVAIADAVTRAVNGKAA